MYCSNLHCSELAPCAVHGAVHGGAVHGAVHGDAGNQQTFAEKVKEKANNAAEAINRVWTGTEKEKTVSVRGEELPEVRTHSAAETVMQMPSVGQDADVSRTVKTEYDTAHTWEQQHEGGLRHRAKEAVVGGVEVVGEKVGAAAEVVKETAFGVQESLAATGHNARVKIENSLEKNLGPTRDIVLAEGQKLKRAVLEDVAHDAELLSKQLQGANESLKDQERRDSQKSQAEKLAGYHTHTGGSTRVDAALERNFGSMVDEVQAEGLRAKEDVLHQTIEATGTLQSEVEKAAASLREQQRTEQASLPTKN
jgi:hypothetical protein